VQGNAYLSALGVCARVLSLSLRFVASVVPGDRRLAVVHTPLMFIKGSVRYVPRYVCVFNTVLVRT
jgi:hypothetical protein